MLAIKAKYIHTLAGEQAARGKALLAPLARLDNAALVIDDNGHLQEICTDGRLPPGCAVRDLGEVTIIPGVVNCHTHIQLSALAGKTRFGEGFVPWLASMIPSLRTLQAEQIFSAIDGACASLAECGTAAVGDIAASLDRGLHQTSRSLAKNGVIPLHFCEWFGFDAPFLPPADDTIPWPLRVRARIAQSQHIADACAPSGHALYSTGGEVVQRAKQWCDEHDRTFTMHLAESPEETELLVSGTGPLRDLYADVVLPPHWRAPGVRPLAYAADLGLLSPGTLAVHGVQLEADEIDTLAASGAALCLCPRSNHNLAVGQAKVARLVERGPMLCLGTDGLSSNTDLDVRNEAIFLREQHDVPPQALVRMLTVNGAAALGLPRLGRLEPGRKVHFAVLPL